MSGRRTVQLHSGTITEYEIRKSKRAKRSSLTLYPNGRLVATIPWFRTELAAVRLVEKQRSWIERQLHKLEKHQAIRLDAISPSQKKEFRHTAAVLLTARLAYYCEAYGFDYAKVSIKEMRSQWGSCSPKKNLNFNIKIIFLPLELVDYIVVHELCHLKELNHGKRFWNLVSTILPDYKKREKALARYVIG